MYASTNCSQRCAAIATLLGWAFANWCIAFYAGDCDEHMAVTMIHQGVAFASAHITHVCVECTWRDSSPGGSSSHCSQSERQGKVPSPPAFAQLRLRHTGWGVEWRGIEHQQVRHPVIVGFVADYLWPSVGVLHNRFTPMDLLCQGILFW